MTMTGDCGEPGGEARGIAGAHERSSGSPLQVVANSSGPQISPAAGLFAFDAHPVVHVQDYHRDVVAFGGKNRKSKISERESGEVHDIGLEATTLDVLLDERQILL